MMYGTFCGNLGDDAKLSHLQDGKAVLNFSIACDGKRERGQRDAPVEWVKCALWGQRAEAIAQYLTKGTFVIAIGSFVLEHFQRRDGSAGTSVSVDVKEIKFTGGQQRQQQGAPQQGGYQGAPQQGYQNQPPQGGFQQNGPHAAGWPPQQQPMQGQPQGGYQGNGGPPPQQGQRRQARF